MIAPLLTLVLAMPTAKALEVEFEQYTLDNGLNVILHKDDTLPQVVVNIWYDVGSRDERAGRTGFAHLFEHLMFMGTSRLPDSGFDDLMEAHGGWNNAWTSEDATDYYDVGPSNLLDTLLWMEADRMDGLAGAMTQDKLDLQRDVVRNERRQSYEDSPYGAVWLELPEALYPDGHPYAHTVIGSHEDLEAAALDDVLGFFNTWYVPANASLVVAGSFDVDRTKASIEKLFGGIPKVEVPARATAPAPQAAQKTLVEVTDQVRVPKTMMAWHSPAHFQPGDAELDLLSTILADGRSSRLYSRLVHEEGSALEVSAYQASQSLSSIFIIELKPAEGHTLEELEAKVDEELAKLAAEGPTAAELERARNQYEMGFLRRLESLQARASALNQYYVALGEPGSFQVDLDRYRNATAEGIQAAAAGLAPDARATLRVLPAPAEEATP